MENPARRTLRLDPWAAEYEASIQIGDEEEGADVDLGVETGTWAALAPPPGSRPSQLAFVDGVRRVEHRLQVSEGDRTVFGLLGSYGVGAAVVGESATVAHESIGRVAVIAGGLAIEPF